MASTKQPQKQMPTTAKQPPAITAMFPSLHEDIENVLSSEDTTITPKPWFNPIERDETRTNLRETYIMGRFQCSNRKCRQKGWGSKKIYIEIQGFPDNGYNGIVFKQRCKTCDNLGTMKINENTYIERVTYWVKKWAGISVDTPDHGEGFGPPHKEELCEGCKAGGCQRARRMRGEY